MKILAVFRVTDRGGVVVDIKCALRHPKVREQLRAVARIRGEKE